MVVSRGSTAGERIPEPEPVFGRQVVGQIGERRGAFVGGNDEIRVVAIVHTHPGRWDDVPAELQDLPCLEDEEILEIVRIAMDVEEHFGVPQDMEWVVDKDLSFPESVIWVQARPAKYTPKKEGADTEYLLDQMTQLFRT